MTNPATILQGWMLPFTILIATGGILWQALLMIVTRRGEPLINVDACAIGPSTFRLTREAPTSDIARLGR